MAANDNPIRPAQTGPFFFGEVEPGLARTKELVTVDELKEDYLFGIPLVSSLTGEEITDASLKRAIIKAISEVEAATKIPITPVRVTDEFDYERADDMQGFGSKRLTKYPILQIEALEFCFPGRGPDQESSWIAFPTNWCRVFGDTGYMRIVPVSGMATATGNDISILPIFGYRSVWEGFWKSFPQSYRVTYVAGFDYEKIPAVVNDLIAVTAAIKVLSRLGPVLFPAQGTSVQFDGMAQSVSTMGPQFLVQRMQELEAEKARLTQLITDAYNTSIILSSW